MGADLDLRPLAYAAFNTLAAVGITFANKAVFAVFHFNYVYLLTFIHALATVAGMHGAPGVMFSSYSRTGSGTGTDEQCMLQHLRRRGCLRPKPSSPCRCAPQQVLALLCTGACQGLSCMGILLSRKVLISSKLNGRATPPGPPAGSGVRGLCCPVECEPAAQQRRLLPADEGAACQELSRPI